MAVLYKERSNIFNRVNTLIVGSSPGGCINL
jgi:hypothetical protein